MKNVHVLTYSTEKILFTRESILLNNRHVDLVPYWYQLGVATGTHWRPVTQAVKLGTGNRGNTTRV